MNNNIIVDADFFGDRLDKYFNIPEYPVPSIEELSDAGDDAEFDALAAIISEIEAAAERGSSEPTP